MVKKLFGETEEQQFMYLQPRLLALGIGIVILLVGFLLIKIGISFGEAIGSIGACICIIIMFMFAWLIMKKILGITTIGALLSGNVVIGVVIFVLFILIGYLGGIFVAFVGLCRFFVLLKKRKGNN